MAGVFPELVPPQKPAEQLLPELTDDLKATELAELAAACGAGCQIEKIVAGEKVLKFPHTQSVAEAGSTRQLVTSCANCSGRRHVDCRP